MTGRERALICELADRVIAERFAVVLDRLREVERERDEAVAARDRLLEAADPSKVYRRGYLAGYGAGTRKAACLPDGASSGRARAHDVARAAAGRAR